MTNYNKSYICIVFSGILLGTIPIFAKLLTQQNIGSLIQILSRLVIPIITYLIFIFFFTRDSNFFPNRNEYPLFLINGLLLFLAFTTYILSIFLGTSPVKAILLIKLHPIFALILANTFLKEKISFNKLFAIIIGVLGAAITIKFWEINSLIVMQKSDFFALANSILYASIVVYGRYNIGNELSNPFNMTIWSFIFAFTWLIFFIFVILIFNESYLISSMLKFNFNYKVLLYIIGMGILSTALPYMLMYYGLKNISSSNAGILLLIEPISVFILAAFILKDKIYLYQLVGGSLILSSYSLLYIKD